MKTTLFNFSKMITTVKYVGAVAVFVTGLAAFSGCAKKGCTDATADNYDADATEDDGTCVDARTKFLGACVVTDNCAGSTYNVTITASSSVANKILISSFGKYGCNTEFPTVEATVSGSDLTIATQTFCPGVNSEYTVSGSGSINGSGTTITINYNGTAPLSDGGAAYSCNATLAIQ